MAKAIRIRVPQLLRERNISVPDMMFGARITSGTCYKLADEKQCANMTSISFDVLIKLCNFFNVGICDVLELVDDMDNEKSS